MTVGKTRIENKTNVSRQTRAIRRVLHYSKSPALCVWFMITGPTPTLINRLRSLEQGWVACRMCISEGACINTVLYYLSLSLVHQVCTKTSNIGRSAFAVLGISSLCLRMCICVLCVHDHLISLVLLYSTLFYTPSFDNPYLFTGSLLVELI